ncbi:MAG: 4'-phosphopantetheinyl transferase superfamily protein, partial [Bacteroidaceae bacterium]|nr:4'-phosphopantetheinyl transferase superfamily protein [Bacteroidaceae bacterium]
TDYPHIHFNLSHCRSAVGCVVSDKPCGLDIERIRRAEDALIRHTMNEEEQAEIANAADKDLAFTILWTRKEAVLKLAGTGISGGLHNALSPDKLESISLTTTARTDYVFSTAVAKEKD